MLKITGIVLAGGQGRRMAGLSSKINSNQADLDQLATKGIEKGLLTFKQQPMILHVLDRLRPQVSEVLINANQDIVRYSAFGYPVIQDTISGYAGPLAGLHAGMQAAEQPYVLSVPCDSPFLAKDLAERLSLALIAQQADIAVAKTGTRTHPVFCLCSTQLLPHLSQYLENGGRKFETWYRTLNAVEVSFDDNPDAFSNINTPDELSALEQTHTP